MPFALRLALTVATSTALYAVAWVFPPATTPCVLLAPLPGLVLATRAPVRDCGLWFFLTTGAIALAFGADVTAGFVLPFGLPTLALAVGIRRFWSFERTVLGGVLTWCLGILCLLLLAYGDVTTVVATLRQQLAHSVDLALSTYESMGVSESVLALAEAERDALITSVIEILPALVVLSGAVMVILNLVLLRRWTDVAHDVNLRLWRAPDALIWALIVTGFGIFLPVPSVALLARNLFLIVLGCYFGQGLAIVSYFLERFRLPRGIRIAGYVLIAVQHVIAAMVLALGVFDLWGNFRRLNAGPADVPFHTDGE
jgi:uncharacterized protein YybS (DUF2232 family)